jgi:transporter family-2 protein
VLGAIYVLIIILTVPKLGAATVLAVTVATQVVLGNFLDHFGWLYLQQRTFSLGRVFGTTSVIVGATLIAIY